MEGRFKRYKSDGRKLVEGLRPLVFDERMAKRLDRMERCGDYLQFAECPVNPEHDSRLQHANFCKSRFCPMCQWRRGLKYSHEAYHLLHEYLSAHPEMGVVHLTVTIRNKKVYTGAIHDEFMEHWKTLRKSKVMKRAVGGLWALEVTNRGRGFHPHIHALCVVPRNEKGLPVLAAQADLSAEWLRITKDSFVVGIRSVYDKGTSVVDKSNMVGLEKAVVEVCKYPFGGVEVEEPAQVLGLMEVMEGRRLVGTWGCLYGLKVDESDLVHVTDEPDDPCCRVCGSELCTVDYLWSGTYYDRHVRVYDKFLQ